MRGGLFNKDSDEEEIMVDAVVDVVEEFTDAATAISQGKRNLLVKEYDGAVAALAQGCSMLAEKHGDTADELGEPFLIYGRALLCLARQEAGVLGNGVPGSDDVDEDDEEGEEEAEAEGSAEKKADEDVDKSEKEAKAEDEEAKPAEDAIAAEESEKKADEEVKPEEKKVEAEASITASEPAASSSSTIEPVAGSSKLNGEASTSNGDAHENGDEDDGEDVDEEDEDSGSNLQVAWEVLELAKLILLKRGPSGWKHLAEAHRLLGEVAMESGNQGGALTDLNACLDLLRKLEPADARSMAEVHYQLGLAHSLTNDFDGSIEQFKEAVSLLETRIKELQDVTEAPKSDDPSYTVAGEIKELKELLPEIEEKIADMRDFKQQACKILIEGIKSKVADGSCSNGAGPSGEGSSSSSTAAKEIKPVSDISHLVRKKRKTDDDTESSSDSQASPCKKPLTEKTA